MNSRGNGEGQRQRRFIKDEDPFLREQVKAWQKLNDDIIAHRLYHNMPLLWTQDALDTSAQEGDSEVSQPRDDAASSH